MHSTTCNVFIHTKKTVGLPFYCSDLIMYLKYQSVEIVHNKSTQISNVITHNLIMDMHTLLSPPCKMLSETYDYHVA